MAPTDDSPRRADLIRSATELIREDGLHAVSLRKVAQRAGVSHGAPLRHFASFAELLSVVAAQGFSTLSAHVDAASAALPPGAGPRARLIAASHAYVDTAVGDPHLFALMFRFDALDVDNPHYRREATAAHERFLACVRAAQDAGWCTGVDTATLNAAMWSQVHGIATLWSQGALPATLEAGGSLDQVVELAMALLLDRSPSG